jgi:hypothetical protein
MITSVALYAAACVLPAISYTFVGPDVMIAQGYLCLIVGPILIVGGLPVLMWVPNPLVVYLWICGFRQVPVRNVFRWLPGVLAVGTLIYLPNSSNPLHGGSFVWAASVILTGLFSTKKQATRDPDNAFMIWRKRLPTENVDAKR